MLAPNEWYQTGKACSQAATVHQREVTHDTWLALNSLYCADVPLSNYSLTHDTWACCSLHSDCTTSNALSYIHNGNSAL